EKKSGKNVDEDIKKGSLIHHHGSNGGRYPQDQENVEDIGAHHVSYGDIHIFLSYGDYGGGQLRKGSTNRHYRKADHSFGPSQPFRDLYGIGNYQSASQDQPSNVYQ